MPEPLEEMTGQAKPDLIGAAVEGSLSREENDGAVKVSSTRSSSHVQCWPCLLKSAVWSNPAGGGEGPASSP